jgi:uncharacterized repeat protein (TIGR03803 family)
MQFPSCLRRLAAALVPCLLAMGVASDARARTQEANLIGFVPLAVTTVTEAPSAIRGDMIRASDGNFYVVSSGGGTGRGVIARITPDGTLSVVHAMQTNDEGYSPYAGVIEGSDGNFYGTTYLGGSEGGGVIYKVAPDGTYTVLRALGQGKLDAVLPYAGLVQAQDGFLYGTTLRGGNNDKGTVFRLSTSGGDFSIIHHFDGANGENPEGALVVGADGNLYGTTLQGGSGNRGTVFRITTTGALTTLYSFPSLGAFNAQGQAINATGANPRAGLLLAADGNFYGTAYQGGTGGWGTVFRMTPAGAVTVMHAFSGPSFGGAYPLSGVSQDAAGNLYGTTEFGGYLNQGTAWRIDAAGQFGLLHSFSGGALDGYKPYGKLVVVGSDLYGVSFADSTSGAGAIFKLDQGTGGVLPVEFSVSSTAIDFGGSATLTWASPTASSCNSGGAWADTIGTSGTLSVTPASVGIYTYTLTCTDGAGVVRTATAALQVRAPALQPVDAGGSGGGGALSVPALLLLGALALGKKKSQESA